METIILEPAIIAQQEQVMANFQAMRVTTVGTYGHDVVYQLIEEAQSLNLELSTFDSSMKVLNSRLTGKMNVGLEPDKKDRTVAVSATEQGLAVVLDAQQSEQPTFNLQEAHLIASLANGLPVSIHATTEQSDLNIFGSVGSRNAPADTPQLILAGLNNIESLDVRRLPSLKIADTSGLRSIRAEKMMDLAIPVSTTEFTHIDDCERVLIGEAPCGAYYIGESSAMIGSAGDIDLNLNEGAIVRVDEWCESETDGDSAVVSNDPEKGYLFHGAVETR